MQNKRKYSWEFIKRNTAYWLEKNIEKKKKRVLLFVGNDKPVSIVESMFFAKKLSELQSREVDVLCYEAEMDAADVYKSFNIGKVITIRNPNFLEKLQFCFNAFFLWKRVRKTGELLSAIYKDIPIGEILYDSIIRSGEFTINEIKLWYIRFFAIALWQMERALALVDPHKYDIFVFWDCDYDRGAYYKVALKRGLIVYQIHHGVIVKHNEKANKKLKLKHHMTIPKYLFEKYSDSMYEQDVKVFLERRFNGRVDNNLDNVAYVGKTKYTKASLYNRLSVAEPVRKSVLLAAHAFSDLPHYGECMIFKDYYDWLIKTIRILAKNKCVNVFVKEHPTAGFYGEEGSVRKILQTIDANNIYLLPEDFNVVSAFSIMDYVVTCQGTIALEASFFGIPTFTASQGYYAGYGIDINSLSVEQYEMTLMNITSYQPLTKDVRKMAGVLLYVAFGRKATVVNPLFQKSRYTDSYEHMRSSELQYQDIVTRVDSGVAIKGEYYDAFEKRLVVIE